MANINQMTVYLTSVAAYVDNYCKVLNEDTKEYATILGYIYRVYQDKIRKVSPQGIALLLVYLKKEKEEDYEKCIDVYVKKLDRIIKRSNSIEEQFEKMDKIKETIK